ncbi:hypothetical protein F9B74_03520 [Pelistega sp. NLN82]|uniref:Lipoprotein n=2 Tax=Pelistega ratti TaxID=2652177 RepID=A0A6L9Y5B1_9BURK|nr:hypothetical protein [Pelistega ratti]
MPYLFRPIAIFSLVILSACTTYRDIPSNSPAEVVYAKMGKPTHECTIDTNTTRLIWSQQPRGQYVYSANLSRQTGTIDRVESVLNLAHFRQLDKGIWSAQDVQCTFGPPAEIGRTGLGEKNEVVWTYRYKEANYWNNVMYIYLGKDGQQVTHYHSGPDPDYERVFWLFY